jgi:hypothetical protein
MRCGMKGRTSALSGGCRELDPTRARRDVALVRHQVTGHEVPRPSLDDGTDLVTGEDDRKPRQ